MEKPAGNDNEDPLGELADIQAARQASFDALMLKIKANNPHLSDEQILTFLLPPLTLGETKLISISSPPVADNDKKQ